MSIMKRNPFALLFLFFISAIAGGGIASSEKDSSAHSSIRPTKGKGGYELYSWLTEGQWNFALFTHTNRLKSVVEITTSPDRVSESFVKLSAHGIDEIKLQLYWLPKNENISWISKQHRVRSLEDPGPLELPPQAIVDVISRHCQELGLKLHILR